MDTKTNGGAKAPPELESRRLAALKWIVQETSSFEHLDWPSGAWACNYWLGALEEYQESRPRPALDSRPRPDLASRPRPD